MQKVNCSVDNCSYNDNNLCYSSRINIGGLGAQKLEDTCCGTFLDKFSYSDLTQEIQNLSIEKKLFCKVDTCEHNSHHCCTLDNINISGTTDTKIYTETNCLSFQNNI